MVDILRIGMSGLLAQQRALSVTSNNIANAATPGYSRQRAEFEQRGVERQGPNFFGTGVDVGNIRRLTDGIRLAQMSSAQSEFSRSSLFADLASSIDGLLADERTGLNVTIQTLVNSMQQVADDPASVSARQALLSDANTFVSRFDMIDERLEDIGSELAGQIGAATADITRLGAGIAEINRQILASGGHAPPDLLDRRDLMLAELSERVAVSSVEQSDGTLSVFIGSGQSLVLGTTASALGVVPGNFDPRQPEIVLQSANGGVQITESVTGGELGGLLDFRREMLAPLRATVGRIAYGVASLVNETHANGMDMNGELGGDFFAIPAPVVAPASGNSGSGTVAVTIADAAALEPTSYRLEHDGAAYTLYRSDDGSAVPMTGSGTALDPFVANGLTIVVGGVPAAGDRHQIQAVEPVAGGLRVLLASPSEIAAAAPTRTRAALGNAGNATISAGAAVDVADPNLLATATIEFLTPTTYSVDGAGSFAYTPGADIVVNGTAVQIAGTPAAGDQFVIESNAGGIGDNRNALAMIQTLNAGLFDSGTTSLQSAVGQLVTAIGIQTADTMNRRDAQGALLEQARGRVDEIRGVNLDEEAAALLRHEQLYQASAQAITVADTLFNSLLAAIRR
jgi:flagellar hook-associated protein 1 FlgK